MLFVRGLVICMWGRCSITLQTSVSQLRAPAFITWDSLVLTNFWWSKDDGTFSVRFQILLHGIEYTVPFTITEIKIRKKVTLSKGNSSSSGDTVASAQLDYYYYCYIMIWMSLVTGLFFLVLLLKQRWSPPLRLQASHCSTFRIMCDVPSIAVYYYYYYYYYLI